MVQQLYPFSQERNIVILSTNGEKLTGKSLELRRKTVCPAISKNYKNRVYPQTHR